MLLLLNLPSIPSYPKALALLLLSLLSKPSTLLLSRYRVTGKQKQVNEVVDTQACYRNLYLSILVTGQTGTGRLYRQDIA